MEKVIDEKNRWNFAGLKKFNFQQKKNEMKFYDFIDLNRYSNKFLPIQLCRASLLMLKTKNSLFFYSINDFYPKSFNSDKNHIHNIHQD